MSVNFIGQLLGRIRSLRPRFFQLHPPNVGPDAEYALVDEFLKMRLYFDQTGSPREQQELEHEIIDKVSLEEYMEAELLPGTESESSRKSPFDGMRENSADEERD